MPAMMGGKGGSSGGGGGLSSMFGGGDQGSGGMGMLMGLLDPMGLMGGGMMGGGSSESSGPAMPPMPESKDLPQMDAPMPDRLGMLRMFRGGR